MSLLLLFGGAGEAAPPAVLTYVGPPEWARKAVRVSRDVFERGRYRPFELWEKEKFKRG